MELEVFIAVHHDSDGKYYGYRNEGGKPRIEGEILYTEYAPKDVETLAHRDNLRVKFINGPMTWKNDDTALSQQHICDLALSCGVEPLRAGNLVLQPEDLKIIRTFILDKIHYVVQD